ncbi:hypothetical protein, partial [Microcoleus sp. AT3-D2]|uniref:hypothetical protein n=1 Tax=Microcoleus sp. AT3-D2 TaxID=2818612 RepID=UPI002FD6536F
MVFKIWQPSASTPSSILDISPWKSVEMRSPHFHLFVWFSQELLHQFLQCIDDRALGDIAPELGSDKYVVIRYSFAQNIVVMMQYSGQFLKRDATPTASNAYAINHRS